VSIYNAAEYPQGVPNPFVRNVQEYPSQQHGGDWTRPMFSMPWIDRPYNVEGPPGNVYSGAPVRGLGMNYGREVLLGSERNRRRFTGGLSTPDIATRGGIFGAQGYGGGIFDGSLGETESGALGVLPLLVLAADALLLSAGVSAVAATWTHALADIDETAATNAARDPDQNWGPECTIPETCQMALQHAGKYFNTSIAQSYCRWPKKDAPGIVQMCHEALKKRDAEMRARADVQRALEEMEGTGVREDEPVPVTPRASSDEFPWGTSSAKTRELQGLINQILQAEGYCPIVADGKLGPGTCGAIAEIATFEDVFVPDSCSGHQMRRPGKPPCGGAQKPLEPFVPPRRASAGGSNMMLVGGAVLAVGLGAFFLTKKRRRK
jgi:hypothetical protein